MKRVVFAWMILVVVTATHCFAAEPAAQPKADPKGQPSAKADTDASEPVIPERELRFEVSEEEHPIRLFAADPKLLDLRYVAVVRFDLSEVSMSVVRRLPPQFSQLYSSAYQGVLTTPYLSSRTEERWILPSLVDNMPKERQLPKDIVSLFTTLTESSRLLRASNPRIGRTRYLQIEVRAPTIERAEELASGLISLYDYGLFYPIQKELANLERIAQESLVQRRTALKQATEELTALEKQLDGMKEYEDIDQVTLGNFITQLRLISVDLAGIEARIEACHKILAKQVSPSHMEKVEAVKITEEIELVGVAARKAAIEEIVEKGRRHVELLGKVEAARKKLHDSLEPQVFEYEELTAEYEEARERLTPFPIQDAKVTIHPIKWESGSQ